MSLYEQTWAMNRRMENNCNILVSLGLMIIIVLLAGILILNLAGCASAPALAPVSVLQKVETMSSGAVYGTVRVGQSGLDCLSQDEMLKDILKNVLISQNLPEPQDIEVKAVEGSSLCGLARGETDELGTPGQGMSHLIMADVAVSWDKISTSQLKTALNVLNSMRPTTPPAFYLLSQK